MLYKQTRIEECIPAAAFCYQTLQDKHQLGFLHRQLLGAITSRVIFQPSEIRPTSHNANGLSTHARPAAQDKLAGAPATESREESSWNPLDWRRQLQLRLSVSRCRAKDRQMLRTQGGPKRDSIVKRQSARRTALPRPLLILQSR